MPRDTDECIGTCVFSGCSRMSSKFARDTFAAWSATSVSGRKQLSEECCYYGHHGHVHAAWTVP